MTATSTPDAAFAARPRLVHLRDALHAVCPPKPSRWGEPPVFFFDPARQTELEAVRPRTPEPPYPVAELVAAELPSLIESVEVRHAARAVPGLREAAAAAASFLPAAKDLADLLAVPDDETILVLHPADRTAWRVAVRGVADAGQFQMLLLDATRSPSSRPARFQCFKPAALLPDGSLPGSFRGSDHWLWPHHPLAAAPRIDGDRVVLLGEPAFRQTGETEPRFPGLAADLHLLESLNPFRVAERLSRLAGRPIPVHVPAEPTLAKAA
jgi:hypothetical protein